MVDKVLAVDVCGTLFDENTTSGFIVHFHEENQNHRKAFFLKALSGRRRLLPFVIAKIGRFIGVDFHKKLFIFTLRGASAESLHRSAASYCLSLNGLKILRTYEVIEDMRSLGWSPVLVSNSLDIVIDAIASMMQLPSVSSILEFENDVCTGKLKNDIAGKKRINLENFLGLKLSDIDFSVITDNESDSDLIQSAKPVYLVAKGRLKHWMSQYNAEIIYY
jgi:phosphoserine phosphatase|tara:strand:- start:281 stop:940 length:660 start_codon:yes stop_codon:yes gene_type:complete